MIPTKGVDPAMATVPNLWEQYVIDNLAKQGFEVYLPFKDKGIDLLAIRDWQRARPVRVQVKGSRVYPDSDSPFYPEGCWHRLNKEKLIRSRHAVDVFVFVWPSFRNAESGRPDMQYLIVPVGDLIDRLRHYQKGRWDMYISLGQQGGKSRVADLRRSPGERLATILLGDGTLADPQRDYTEYLNNWDSIAGLARGTARQLRAK